MAELMYEPFEEDGILRILIEDYVTRAADDRLKNTVREYKPTFPEMAAALCKIHERLTNTPRSKARRLTRP